MLIDLTRNEIGQMLDGLEQRAQSYSYAALFHEGKMSALAIEEAGFVVEEVSDATEAYNIAAAYQEIINKVREQLPGF